MIEDQFRYRLSTLAVNFFTYPPCELALLLRKLAIDIELNVLRGKSNNEISSNIEPLKQ